jgi:hypothetical protein
MVWEREEKKDNEEVNQIMKKKIAKERKVIPDPIDDRKFQEWKESGKSGILLGITLNPRKCIGEKVRRIPINVETKW